MSIPKEKQIEEQVAAKCLNEMLSFPDTPLGERLVNDKLILPTKTRTFYDLGDAEGSMYIGVRRDNETHEQCRQRAIRAYYAHVSLYFLARRIPNYATAVSKGTLDILRFHREDREIRYGFDLTVPPGRRATYAQCLSNHATERGDLLTYTLFAQIVCAAVMAFEHVNFVHNKLMPSNIILLDYAPLFTLNYDTCSLVCTEYIALITGLDAAQFSYVVNERIMTTSPGLQYVNIDGHVSSDLYSFILACCKESETALKTVPKSNRDVFIAMQRRKQIFDKMLEFYWKGPVSERPGNIVPYGTGKEFIEHMVRTFRSAGLLFCLDARPTYSNIHCPVVGSREETLYTGDIHSLVLRNVPRSLMDPSVGVLGYRRPSEKFTELCSERTHDAFERLCKAPQTASLDDFTVAIRELPVLLLMDKETYRIFTEREDVQTRMERQVTGILNTVVCTDSHGGTGSANSTWTVSSIVSSMGEMQIKDDPNTPKIQVFE